VRLILWSCPVLASKKKKPIIVDPGHGGFDKGAVGCHNLLEKNISLLYARKLTAALKKKGYDVILTRNNDDILGVKTRTKVAHAHQGALYLSIHTNAHPDSSLEGFEVWSVKKQFFDCCQRTSKLFFSHKKPLHALDILHAHDYNTSLLSASLATSIQNKVIKHLHTHKEKVKDRRPQQGLKRIPLHLFIPSVFIELGFITHQKESKNLINARYQDLLIEGIVQGVSDFMKSQS
jgi:N-acetylmuramoyl-L-alanine amidase